MFDWFWNFLYGITKGLIWVCDQLLRVANVLIGIDPISVNGTSTDLITYLIRSDKVTFAFAACAVLAIIVLTMFTIFQILRTIAKEGDGMTPGQICMKSFKTFMIFLFVPAIMLALIVFMNAFMKALYTATLTGASSLGQFMFASFADMGECWHNGHSAADFISANANYNSTSVAREYCDINDFPFINSWIVSFVVMYNISASLLMFVDRAISIVILYVLAPFPIAASVMDDGARFKSWREQVLNKFLVAFGVLLAINFYIMVMSLVTSSSVVLISSSKLLNAVAKLLIILGGAMTTKKAGALIGSMVSASGGNEVNDPAFRGNALKSALGAAVGAAWGGVTGAVNLGRDISKYGFGGTVKRRGENLLHNMGFKTNRDYAQEARQDAELYGNGGGSGAKNENDPQYDRGNGLKNALENGNQNNNQNNNNSNQNNNETNNKKNNMLEQAMGGEGAEKKNNNDEEQ